MIYHIGHSTEVIEFFKLLIEGIAAFSDYGC